jgi:hypothetical protein
VFKNIAKIAPIDITAAGNAPVESTGLISGRPVLPQGDDLAASSSARQAKCPHARFGNCSPRSRVASRQEAIVIFNVSPRYKKAGRIIGTRLILMCVFIYGPGLGEGAGCVGLAFGDDGVVTGSVIVDEPVLVLSVVPA